MEVVFLAGASGAVGMRLVPQLIDAGYAVFGMTRSADRARVLEGMGATAVVADVFDYPKLAIALQEARPSIVIDQLTDLPKTVAGPLCETELRANARIRKLGTRNLLNGTRAAGARRFIIQSIAWIYAPGHPPFSEGHPLAGNATGAALITNASVIAAEQMALHFPPLESVVLRYGQFYGPGTWNTAQGGQVPVHVDAAARAAVLAITAKHPGIFNIAEEKGLVSSQKARRELGWSADFRMNCDAATQGR